MEGMTNDLQQHQYKGHQQVQQRLGAEANGELEEYPHEKRQEDEIR